MDKKYYWSNFLLSVKVEVLELNFALSNIRYEYLETILKGVSDLK